MNPLVVQGAAQLLLGKYKSQKGMFMKNVMTMAVTGLVIFAGLGWYLDWYKVARTTSPDGKQHITIDVNTKRIESDIEKGKDKVSGYLGGLNTPNSPAPPYYGTQPVPQPTPPAYNPNAYPPSYPPAYQPAQPSWVPASPTNRPAAQYPGYAPPTQPYQPIPGRPF